MEGIAGVGIETLPWYCLLTAGRSKPSALGVVEDILFKKSYFFLQGTQDGRTDVEIG